MATANVPVSSASIYGKILSKEFRLGIANLVLAVFDLDEWADPEGGEAPGRGMDPVAISRDPLAAFGGDVANLYKLGRRVGSAVTNSAGEFAIELLARDVSSPRRNEQRPDLILLVLAPDEPGLSTNKRLLHLSMDVRFNACSSEAHLILLPTSLLKERGIPYGETAATGDEGTRAKVSAYVKERQAEQDFDAGAADFHGAAATREVETRKTFRKDVIRQLATDFASSPLPGRFAAEGDDLKSKHAETVLEGIATANQALGGAAIAGVPVNLYLTPADREGLGQYLNGATGYVDIPGATLDPLLFRASNTDNPGALLFHNNPIASFCAEDGVDVACAREHTAPAHIEPPPLPESPALPPVREMTDEHVREYMDRLVRDIPSPDGVLRPDLGKRRKDKDVDASVGEFSLQKGPAELPAFYDFHSVQIAFEHVWQQLFDETIPNLAYTANALGKAKFGVNDLFNHAFTHGLLTNNLFTVITPVEVPAIVARFFDVTKEEYNELSFTNRQQLSYLAVQIEECTGKAVFFPPNMTYSHVGSKVTDQRMIQSLTDQGERLIDAVRHDTYHTLHKTLRDLNDRLNGKYEFTVFAADKDYHSVNFGLMNTYRQLWVPLQYQAGKLLRTVPLAPKEGRTYKVTVRRQEKRASKEAKRNNSSITNEQASTSRVEAEIMAKAQNKTNFGMTAEGDFNVGVYQGKGTTTFGVEAIGESAQNRKDFRESVLKAVQDYKSETTTEVTTDTDFSSESDESGTIVNPNDEVAVTYLFYELQKRYRVSEQIHRVMPVVMVAQPMPSPDQITPAWVLAYDWILNRHILDDSFRPTLRYLASNSVGDDFSLRELRKNLRQQRNLVETLRIEFSAASQQADNRYAALESQIARRIAAEEAESSDGLLTDVAEFIGRGPIISSFFGSGGGPNPEAAKARELAAKDAHQYALEKAEKASAALKQEVTTLHQMTEHYNKTLQARLDNETQVKRLLVHIRDNIFYYMQAIWSMEPPDQRYLRLHNVRVPVLELASRSYRVKVETDPDIFANFREPGTERHRAFLHGTLKHNPSGGFDTRPLVDVADLGKVVCCIGNYLVFAMKEHNALTEFMAAPYIDAAFGAMDPDDLSNVSLDEYGKYVCCLRHQLDDAAFDALKPQLLEWLKKLLASPLRNGDQIVVPTGSLFIESLVDPNPILETFKLQHRELDVFKVQEEVRHAGLENLRLASRLVNHEREDPDIEKKIVLTSDAAAPVIDVDDA